MTTDERGARPDEDLARRVAELEALVASLEARLGAGAPPTAPTPAAVATGDPTPLPRRSDPAPPADPDEGRAVPQPVGVDRRRLLTRAGTAAVGAVLGGAAVSVASASPAAAATGSFDSADQSTPALTATNTAGGVALLASTTGEPDRGPTVDISSNGEALRVVGTGIRSPIVVDHQSPALATMVLEGQESSIGIYAKAKDFSILGETFEGTFGTGVSGASHDGIAGVSGMGYKRAAGGVFESEQGIGLTGIGGKAQLALRYAPGSGPAMAPPRSRADEHRAGEVYLDDDGNLWLCTGAGTPGTWVRITGAGSAGAFQVLPEPKRAYDTRPTYPPALGPKTPMPANQARTIDLTDAGVPSDATAATVSATVTNTTGGAPWGPGYLSLYAGGTPEWPGTSNLNWTGPGQTVAVTTVVPLGPDATLNAYAKHPTDLILDVIGYYR